MPDDAIELRVGEIPTTMQQDVGRGMVRLDSSTMSTLGISPGAVVEVEGKRATAAIADRAYPSDVGMRIVRMDGLTRRNAGTTIGDTIKVRAADFKEAEHISIAPTQEGVTVRMPGEVVGKTLIGRSAVKGDVIELRSLAAPHPSHPFDEFYEFLSDELAFGRLGMGQSRFMVVSTSPKGVVRITESTKIEVHPEAVEVESERIPEVTYEDIGGLSTEVRRVREMIELPLKHPELFERLGIDPPTGVLLYGPPGTGKTLLAKAVANESNANFVSINGPEIMSKYVGEAEKRLRELFEEAQKNAPSIIFIDEIDAIAPKREDVVGGVESRVVAQMLASMDGINSRGQVIVIAATNRETAIEPALRRAGRFDREIEIGVPDRKGRKEVLQIHTRNMPLAEDVSLDEIADAAHGFVGSDLQGLSKEAAMSALRRLLPLINIDDDERLSNEVLEKLIVNRQDYVEGLKVVRPSAMREVLVEVPNITWDDIGGCADIKQELVEAVEWPLKNKAAFDRLGIRPPTGILLYGPPGTGKTLLAKAVSNESEANFISVKGPEVLSKWLGESEKAIREIFRKARQVAPTVVFFDELDAIASSRGGEGSHKAEERVVNQMLTEIDGLEDLQDVVIIGATNRPDIIDRGLMRAGRFDRHILVGAPDEAARLEILKVHTKNMPLAKDVNLKKLAKETENCVGSDLEAICRESAIFALRKDMEAKQVSLAEFEKAREKVHPSLTKEVKKFYELVQKALAAPQIKEEPAEDLFYMR
ncbi:MAG: CDC48 family AAA ATPase [Candidatus Undinarchaeales archaeon]|jgi:transitional endoplasmic reticulum ATPase|nr:CDC48 family AAA ATPase [Candidatus Undinarchaeales archaeon]MDP7493005.1 CDC48 family AAA ATPase [Candidatus Undinarchaeales archaeon]